MNTDTRQGRRQFTDRSLRLAATRPDPQLGKPTAMERMLLQLARVSARYETREPEAYLVYAEDGTRRDESGADAWMAGVAQQALEMFGPYGDVSGKVVLDIGCGPGSKSLAWLSAGAENVIGVDPDPARIAAARERAVRAGLADRASFEVGLGEQLPLEKASVDVVIMTDVMEHLPKPEGTLTECRRVLRPGGLVLINFKTFFSPRGSHVNDWLSIPWVHLLFGEKVVVRALARVSSHNPWVRFHFPSLEEHPLPGDLVQLADGGLNRMTLRRFRHLIDGCGLEVADHRLTGYSERQGSLGMQMVGRFSHLPLLDELMGGYVVTVLRNTAPRTAESP